VAHSNTNPNITTPIKSDDPDVPITAYAPVLYIDNNAAIALTQDTKFHNKAKHIDIRYSFIRNDMHLKNRLRIASIPGTDQVADILTKQRAKDRFTAHYRSMGLIPDN
jgi:hypothetical protein